MNFFVHSTGDSVAAINKTSYYMSESERERERGRKRVSE